MIDLDYRSVLTDSTVAAEPGVFADAPALTPRQQAQLFAATVLRSTTIRTLIERLSGLGLPPWYLAAGALAQTVWNACAGSGELQAGIRDYDVVYFDDTDLTYAAEAAVITRVGTACADVTDAVEVRNQARVHLWYPEHFGYTIDPHLHLEAAIDTFPATCTSVGIRLTGQVLTVYATHGLSDLLSGTIRSNPGCRGGPEVLDSRARRWVRNWPALTYAAESINEH